ncbi:MAG: type I pullulanase [Bacilli bacterium]|nr:type I pullulanase [Bacilli bacterium]
MKKTTLLLFAPVALCCLAFGHTYVAQGEAETPLAVKPATKNAYSGALPSFDPAEVENSVIIHYHRTDDNYDDYALWLWDHGNGGDGSEYLPRAIDSYGSVFYEPLSTWSPGNWPKLDLGVIVKSKGSWAEKDPDGDRYIVMSELNMDDNGNYSVWLWTGITAIYTSEVTYPYYISRAYFQDFSTLIVESGNGSFTKVELYRDGTLFDTFEPEGGSGKAITCTLKDPSELTHTYSVKVYYGDDLTLESPVDVSVLYESPEFLEKYTYDGELGAIYSAESTTFKVWSPMATSISLNVYDNGTPESLDSSKGSDTKSSYDLVRGEKGVWSVTVPGDLGGKYYTYVVTNHKYDHKEVVDPYAQSSGINGLRGQIVDFSKTNPEGWDGFQTALPIEKTGLVVYETHVADITASETWGGTPAKRGKYLGLVEGGTTFSRVVNEKAVTVKTGFDHIKELGVNAVQLQPIFDQANDERPETYRFNWGYNPLNYNVLEGAYSSDPYDGYAKIREFKTVVKGFRDAGINVIMDVVYNHVNSVENQLFDVLAPGYFFRYSSNGALSNGSGCGNETASDRAMFRKFMVDSTSFWAKEYKLGGFRFDLMALHDLQSMKELTAKLLALNPHMAVYGEPWAGGSTTLETGKQASQANGSKFIGYGQFNDGMRDSLVMSGMKGVEKAGFAYNRATKPAIADVTKIVSGLKGFTVSTGTVNESLKTVNYVTCHDNFTINDRILAYENAIGEKDPTTPELRAKMNLLAQSFALTSQGTSFFLAGEEMLRSKYELTPSGLTTTERLNYAHNSYNSTDEIDGGVVNAIDYARKATYPELFQGYQKLIELKKTLPGLQQDIHKVVGDDTSSLVDVSRSSDCNQVINKFTSDGVKYMVVYNGGYGNIPAVDFSGYELVYDSSSQGKALGQIELQHFQVIVAKESSGPTPGGSGSGSSETPAKSGCGSSIVGGSIILAVGLALGAAFVVAKKRKQD